MIASGSISVLAGVAFVLMASTAGASLAGLAGYALLGGIFFLVSALRLGRTTGRDAPSRICPSVADFLDALEIGTVDLVGHSVGGAVALHLALADPARVRTLTLVASAGLGRR